MNTRGFIFVTKPPEAGDNEQGYVLVFRLQDLTFVEAIEDKEFCSLAGGARHSEKYIPDYPDLKATIQVVYGGGTT